MFQLTHLPIHPSHTSLPLSDRFQRSVERLLCLCFMLILMLTLMSTAFFILSPQTPTHCSALRPPPTPHPLTLDMSSPYFAMAITCSCSNIYRRLVWIAPCKDVNHILIQIHGKSLQHGYLNAQPYVEFRTT